MPALALALVADSATHKRPLSRRRYAPMTATPHDLRRLRNTVALLRTQPETTERNASIYAVERAIRLLSEDTRSTTIGWVLAALSQSVERNAGGRLYVADWELFEWAIGQVKQLAGGDAP